MEILPTPNHLFSARFKNLVANFKCACICSLFLTTYALAQTPSAGTIHSFTSIPLGISATWPGDFEQIIPVAGLPAGAVLLLKYRDGFPTFNILRTADTLPVDPAYEVIESYHRAGFSDAAIESNFTTPQGWPGFELSYHSAGNAAFHSGVVLIPQQNSYFVLTFVDPAEKFPADKTLFDQLIHSITIVAVPPPLPPARKSIPTSIIILGVLAAIVAISWRRFASRHQSKT